MRPERDHQLPAGYEYLDLDSRTGLALPSGLALRRSEELRQRAILDDELRRTEQAVRHEELKQQAVAHAQAKAAQAQPQVPLYPEQPAPGYYRVLPDLQEMLDADGKADISLRAVDKDVRERQQKLHKRLLEKGPDRKVARPPDWRRAIADLEIMLPNFYDPIRLFRNAFALADASAGPVRMPPMLLLGPPGIGKTLFTHRIAQLMGAPHAAIAFDQPTAGAALRGSDSYWGNTSTGLLFNLICLGDCANPVILLDEIDKSAGGTGHGDIDPLAQLHGALEPETARCIEDSSVHISFDASLVTYVATANSLRGLTLPILSRMEVFSIQPTAPSDAVEIARAVTTQVLGRLGLADKLQFDRKSLYVLAHLSPRLMVRTVEKAVACAVATGQPLIGQADLWAELGPEPDSPRLH